MKLPDIFGLKAMQAEIEAEHQGRNDRYERIYFRQGFEFSIFGEHVATASCDIIGSDSVDCFYRKLDFCETRYAASPYALFTLILAEYGPHEIRRRIWGCGA